MECILCDESALEYWRRRSEPEGGMVLPAATRPVRRGSFCVEPPTKQMVADLRSWGLVNEGEVHLLVPARGDRRDIRGATCTVLGADLARGSFVRTLGNVYAVCPELLFVMMARKLALVELLELGYELCGSYRYDSGRVLYHLQPLTSAALLEAYVQKAKGIEGLPAARQALRWLADGSGSPAETALAIVFRLPLRLGGYALGSPLLNAELELNEAAAKIAGRGAIRPDFYWPAAHYPVEFDGALYHSSREQAEYDERRRNTYAAMGMGVTVFRSRHLSDLGLMDSMAFAVRRNAGIRHRAEPAAYAERHRDLFEQVFDYWLRLKGRVVSQAEYDYAAASRSVPEVPW